MTTEQAPGLTIEMEVRVDASPETVFGFLIDPQRYVRWQGERAELDPRPGGLYRVVMDEANTVRGEYLEVQPPRRVVFTWGWEGNDDLPPGSTTVEVDLIPDGDGTIVRLRHTGLPDERWRAMHEQGWEMYLGNLRTRAPSEPAG